MDQAQTYIVVRDTDIDALTDAVNERIEEGYELAGPLFCVPPSAGQAPIFVQPMTLAAAEEEEEDEDDDDEYADDDDVGTEEEDETAPTDDTVVYRRKR